MSIGASGYYNSAYYYQHAADGANSQQARAAVADGADQPPSASVSGRNDPNLPNLPHPSVRDYDCSRAIHDVDFDEAEECAADDDTIAGPDARSEAAPSLERSGSMSSIASSHSASDGSDASWRDQEDVDIFDMPLFEPVFDDIEGPFAALRQLNAAGSVNHEMARASRSPRRASVEDRPAGDSVRSRRAAGVDFEGPFAALRQLNDAAGEAPNAPRASRPPHRVAVDEVLAISNMSREEACSYLLARVRGILNALAESDGNDE